VKVTLKTLPIRRGERLTIRAIATPAGEAGKRDKCPVLAFFEEQSEQHAEDFAELLALLDLTAKQGPPANETKFKHLSGTDGLFEFKTGGGLRVFCFWDEGSLIVCTHGLVKKKNKTPKEEIKRAEKMKSEYEKAKEKGQLYHVEPK
jgi:phage-related protein